MLKIRKKVNNYLPLRLLIPQYMINKMAKEETQLRNEKLTIAAHSPAGWLD